MTSAVLDANVLASGFASSAPGAAPAALIDAWRAEGFVLVTSEHILEEVARTFAKAYFRGRMQVEQIERAIFLLRHQSLITRPTVEISGIATHPEDDLVLATAVSARADYLVTGDRPFRLRVPEYQGVRTLTPREFLDLLLEEDGRQ